MRIYSEDQHQLAVIARITRDDLTRRILTDDVDEISLTNGKSAHDESRSVEQHIRSG